MCVLLPIAHGCSDIISELASHACSTLIVTALAINSRSVMKELLDLSQRIKMRGCVGTVGCSIQSTNTQRSISNQ